MSQVKIMAGVQGSGKSTWAAKLAAEFTKLYGPDSVIICCADDYHVEDGKYVYNKNRANDAHNKCLAKYLLALTKGIPLVIVDNTNCTAWEISVYYRLAAVFEYEAEIVRMETPPAVAYARNIHGVDAVTVGIKQGQMQVQHAMLPKWWKIVTIPYTEPDSK